MLAETSSNRIPRSRKVIAQVPINLSSSCLLIRFRRRTEPASCDTEDLATSQSIDPSPLPPPVPLTCQAHSSVPSDGSNATNKKSEPPKFVMFHDPSVSPTMTMVLLFNNAEPRDSSEELVPSCPIARTQKYRLFETRGNSVVATTPSGGQRRMHCQRKLLTLLHTNLSVMR